jgi:hypothetical protein
MTGVADGCYGRNAIMAALGNYNFNNSMEA